MLFKKFYIIITLTVLSFCGVALSQDSSFLQKRYYLKNVKIDNPETSPLAEAFLRNGISITNTLPRFSFKTEDSGGDFTVFIYYAMYGTNDFVGKFIYEKKKSNEETREFVNAFVSWMLKNAWPKK